MTKNKQPKPIGARILIKTDEVNIGGFKITAQTAKETATVIAIGDGWDLKAEPLKVGDKIHVKSWAFDIVQEGDNVYNYIWQKTGGVCGIIKIIK